MFAVLYVRVDQIDDVFLGWQEEGAHALLALAAVALAAATIVISGHGSSAA